MSASPHRTPRSRLLAGSTLALVAAAGAVHAWTDVDYPQLTNTRRSYVDFNVEVVRGFVLRTDPEADPELECFSVNAYASTIQRHTALSGAPVNIWPTLTNPVSIAFHGDDLLVVGQGNHALARHDSATGAMLDVIMLGSEPADIVVDDETDMAYVSCMGDDAVWEVDLSGATFAIGTVWSMRSTTHNLPLKRPRFLSLDPGGEGTSDNVVYVAPFISGNNTITSRLNTILPEGVHDGNDTSLFPADSAIGGSGLPDVDLFRLKPSTGAVDKVLRQVGSIVTAHGKNPSTGDYWMLGIQEHNVDPLMQSEPDLRGKFATNSLTIASSLPTSGAPATPGTPIDLDDTTTGGSATYQTDKSVSFPYALDFKSDGGAVIGSSTSPIVVLMSSSGTRQRDFKLASTSSSIQGRVVRTVKFHGTQMLAYCQQTSNIVVFNASPYSSQPTAEMSLGNDPTPDAVKAGRAIWYDATRSLNGRTTCNTCHPQGGADGLVWNLGDVPVDDKGPLVTQPLLGIEDTFPYHWRGERTLADFNGAFPGLLGASAELDAEELRQFEEFVFSLRPHANPLQDRDRMIKDGLMTDNQAAGIISGTWIGSPSNGVDLFLNRPSDGAGKCVTCHSLPTGSNGEFFPDHINKISARANFEVAHLNNQITLKRQPIVNVMVETGATDTAIPSNLLGSGNAVNGVNTNLFDFMNVFFLGFTTDITPPINNPPAISQQEIADLTAFVHMFDTGTAPSVHWAVRYDQASSPTTTLPIRNQLLAQAADGWVGVVVRGVYPVGSPPTIEAVNWYYDAATLLFVPDRTAFASGTLAAQNWTQFKAATNAGQADNVFFGVPPGNEFRLGADMDHDGLEYGPELALGTPTDPWNPDTDGDGWADGYEIDNGSTATSSSSVPSDTTAPALVGSVRLDFINAKEAKLVFETDEPVKWSITLTALDSSSNPYPNVVDARATYDTNHCALVQGLHPSPRQILWPSTLIDHSWTLVLTDLSNNTTTITDAGGSSAPDLVTGEIILETTAIIGDLALSGESRPSSTSYSATVDVQLIAHSGLLDPVEVPGWRPVLQVLKLRAGSTNDWDLVPTTDLVIAAAAPGFEDYDDFVIDLDGPSPNGPNPHVSYSANVLPGSYLVLEPASSTGYSQATFTVSGLTTNQPILVNVVTAFNDDGMSSGTPSLPEYDAPAFARFVNPAIPTELRNVKSSL